MISLVRRKQMDPSSKRKFENESAEGDLPILAMYFLKLADSSIIGTRRKEIRAPRSSKEFWIGVPVKHQRCCA